MKLPPLALLIPLSGHAAGLCTVAGSALAFGSYSPASPADATTTASVNMRCPPGILGAYTLNFGPGNYGSAAAGQSRMLGAGASRLHYDLYADPGFTQKLGDAGAPGTFSFSDDFILALAYNRTWTVFGKIPRNQPVAAGLYADSVTLTVTY